MRRHPPAAVPSPLQDRRQARVFGAVASLLLASYAAACLWVWYAPGWQSHWDSALYLLTARSLAAGEGYRYLDQPFFLRPPGFSWLLSWLPAQEVFDAAPYNRLVMAFAATSVAAVYLALVPLVGRTRALAIALLTGTNPVFANRFNWVLSEFPFMTALYAGFALMARMRSGRREVWLRAAGAAACFAAAFYVRTAALLVLPALLLSLPGRRWRPHARPLLAVVGLVLVAALPWSGYVRSASAAAPTPSEQLLVADHTTAMFRTDPGDPDSEPYSLADWGRRLRRHAVWTLGTLGWSALGSRTYWAGGLVLGLALLGLAGRLRQGLSPLEWYGLSSLALIQLYWYPSGRYFVPLVPILYLLLGAGIDGLECGLRRWLPRLPGQSLAIAALAIFALSNAQQFSGSFDPRRAGGGSPVASLADSFDAIAGIADWLRSHTGEEDTILCHDAPMYALLTGRRAYTYRFRPGVYLLDKYRPDVVMLDRPGWSGAMLRRALEKAGHEPVRIAPSTGRTEGVLVYLLRDQAPFP